MKLTKETIESLAYLAEIHQSILVRSGNILRSRNASRNVLAKIQIDESFPMEFMIYDIKDFLRVVKLFNEPTVEFVGTGDSGHMVLSENSAKVRYKFSAKELYENPPADVDYTPNHVKWSMDVKLSEAEIDNIVTVSNVMKLDIISFSKDKIKLLRGVGSDEFTHFEVDYANKPVITGDAPDDFYINFSTKHFILKSGSYDVNFFCGGTGHPTGAKFVKDDNKVVVWVGAIDSNG